MTRRHLISFAYVSCPCVNFFPRLWSNLYFCHSQNSQKIGHSLLSKSLPHDNIQLHLPGKSTSANFQSFCSTRTIVKEVLARHILMSWIFATSSIFPNHCSPQNLSPIYQYMWVWLQHSYFCPVWYFAKQVPPRLLLLSWKFVNTVLLVIDHPQPKLTTISHVHFPYR